MNGRLPIVAGCSLRRPLRLLCVVLMAAIGLAPAWGQPGSGKPGEGPGRPPRRGEGGPPPHGPGGPHQPAPLSPEAGEVAKAILQRGTIRWQGERLIELHLPGAQPRTWMVRDGVEPGQPIGRYYTTEAVSGTQLQAIPAGGLPAEDVYGPLGLPWFEALLNQRPILGQRLQPGQHFERQLQHFEITSLGEVTTGARKGTAYRIAPRYPGGYVELVVDAKSGLPVQVERYSRNGVLRFRTRYQQLESAIDARQFWFAAAVRSPQSARRLPHGSLLQPPPAEPGGPERPLLGRGIASQIFARLHPQVAEKFLPPGFHPGPREILQVEPFPLLSVTYTDGLNPLTMYVARLPKGMASRPLLQRIQTRLTEGPYAMPAPWQTAMKDNWLLVAVGELDEPLLERALARAEFRLARLAGEGELPPAGPPPGPPGGGNL